MPEKETIERAQEDAREGKSPSTQAGEFVREEIHHVREGKHGVRSPKQAIAIGLSKARKAGVKLPPPPTGSASSRTQSSGKQSSRRQKPSRKRSQATLKALKREGRSGASRKAACWPGEWWPEGSVDEISPSPTVYANLRAVC